MTEQQNKYFDLFFNKRITEYKKIDEYKNWELGKDKKTYKSLDMFFLDEIKLDENELKEIRKHFEEYKKLFDAYINEERKELFKKHDAFMSWYNDKKNKKNEIKCGYCKITESQLKQLVKLRGDNLTLNGKQKRSKGTMEIEKMDSNGDYTYENCIMACPLCNNAKSNLISDEDWRRFFVEPMKKYYDKELNKATHS